MIRIPFLLLSVLVVMLGVVLSYGEDYWLLQPLKNNPIDLSFSEDGAKTIVDLQPFRHAVSSAITTTSPNPGTVTLVNLNRNTNAWYLIHFKWHHDQSTQVFHLESIYPQTQALTLSQEQPFHLVIQTKDGAEYCKLWSEDEASELTVASESGQVFVPLCHHKIYLRNKVSGNKTTLEWGTDFVRDYLPAGERITTFVKEFFFKDAYLEIPEETIKALPETSDKQLSPSEAPARPLINDEYADIYLKPARLGLELELDQPDSLLAGRWYKVKDQPGVFVSVLQPKLIVPELISKNENLKAMDDIEAKALVYMVAFDIELFSIEFALGTEHPRLNWADRVVDKMKDSNQPGPDGIDSSYPLNRTGKISPVESNSIAATFTGGFKRAHGAFHQGSLALVNHGSHYGFIEEGVIFSSLQPGLATVLIYDDGFFNLKTWKQSDLKSQPSIRFARQNGIPLVDLDPITGLSKPGDLVPYWSAGNWSGSARGLLRSLRAGLALHQSGDKRFIFYGYFSTVTPSTMARVFQAYQVSYAMLLDMNALEHTYLATYKREQQQFKVNHLVKDMNVLDKTSKGITIPRFIGFADNRDFFYLLRKADH